MLIMDKMAEPENNDEDSDDSRDFISDMYNDEALAHERDEFFSEFIEEVDADLPPIPKVRIKITKQPNKRKKKSSIQLDGSKPRQSGRISKHRVNYEILDDVFINEDTLDLPSPLMTDRKNTTFKSSKTQGQGLKTHYRRPRYGVKNARREVVFNPDALPGTICYNSSKVYDQSGTTCHQCRQKTIDLKSRCYSPYCHGVRGQFCGYCLKQRYGEDVAIVLRDPNWKCPPCRRICNCSICRRSHGKPPTGQLYQFAMKNGFSSVKEYLAELGDDKLEHDVPNGGDDEENASPQENNVTADQSHPDEDSWRLRIKQEPIDYEFSDLEFVQIKEEPVDDEFEGIEVETQIVGGCREICNGEEDDTQHTCVDMIEFGPITVKLEKPDTYEFNAVDSEI